MADSDGGSKIRGARLSVLFQHAQHCAGLADQFETAGVTFQIRAAQWIGAFAPE